MISKGLRQATRLLTLFFFVFELFTPAFSHGIMDLFSEPKDLGQAKHFSYNDVAKMWYRTGGMLHGQMMQYMQLARVYGKDPKLSQQIDLAMKVLELQAYDIQAAICLSEKFAEHEIKKKFTVVPEAMAEAMTEVSKDCATDLRLVVGDEPTQKDPNSLEHSMYSSLFKDMGIAGWLAGAKLITTPTHDVDIIKKRQAIIKKLMDNPELLEKLEQQLKNFKKHEKDLIHFYREDLTADSESVLNASLGLYLTGSGAAKFFSRGMFNMVNMNSFLMNLSTPTISTFLAMDGVLQILQELEQFKDKAMDNSKQKVAKYHALMRGDSFDQVASMPDNPSVAERLENATNTKAHLKDLKSFFTTGKGGLTEATVSNAFGSNAASLLAGSSALAAGAGATYFLYNAIKINKQIKQVKAKRFADQKHVEHAITELKCELEGLGYNQEKVAQLQVLELQKTHAYEQASKKISSLNQELKQAKKFVAIATAAGIASGVGLAFADSAGGSFARCLDYPVNAAAVPFRLAMKVRRLVSPAMLVYRVAECLPYAIKYGFYRKCFKDIPHAFTKSYQRVAGVAELCNSTTIVAKTLEDNSLDLELSKYILNFPKNVKQNNAFGKMIKKLRHPIFKEDPEMIKPKHFFIGHTGRILSTYRELYTLCGFKATEKEKKEPEFKPYLEHQHKFANLLEAMGELQAYCAAARMMLDHQQGDNKCCFVKFDQESKTPMIDFNKVWNPMVGKDKAQSNDIKLGGSSTAKHMVLSGPNTGGKSTYMRAVMFGIIMAQTFGIMPAESATMTPFVYINSFEKDGERPADGISSFHAQALKAKQIFDDLEKSAEKGFSFFIGDELFKGTEQDHASAVCIALAKKLTNQLPNSMLILASHGAKTPFAEEQTGGAFANYQVLAKSEDGERIIPTYKIGRGATDTSTCFDVMRRAGFGDDVIGEAKQVYQGFGK